MGHITYVGIARIDRCGEPVWTQRDGKAHHSIAPAADGDFWISGLKSRRVRDEDRAYLAQFGGLEPPIYEDLFIKISPDGEILQRVSSLEVLQQKNLMHLLYQNGSRPPRRGPKDPGFRNDVMHLNDVEELWPAMAGRAIPCSKQATSWCRCDSSTRCWCSIHRRWR